VLPKQCKASLRNKVFSPAEIYLKKKSLPYFWVEERKAQKKYRKIFIKRKQYILINGCNL
jgi:hypothetical protein